jgi:excisionase family DNA binding protein
MDEEFLTVAEIADTLKINQQTVRNWIDQGSLPAVRVGNRRVRVTRSDLDAFLATATTRPEPTATAAEPDAEEPFSDDESEQVAREELDLAWQGFAVAMTEATAKLAAGKPRALANALLEVSDAARLLAEALGGAVVRDGDE